MEWYNRFWTKEKWIKKSAEIEGKLYDRLKEISEKEWDEIFMSVFNEEEQKIYDLMKKKKKQEEIAKELGYQTQSAISKKKKVMLEKVHKEIDKRTKV